MAKAEKVEKKTLEEAFKELDKTYGKNSVISGKDKPAEDIEVVSTGSLGIDIATGIGGIPLGKIIEIYGWESSGKSTLTQTIIGNYQKLEKQKEARGEGKARKALLCDTETSLDPEYATALGVDLDELLIIQLDEFAGEAIWEKVKILVETGEIGMVVIDSYNNVQPKKVLDSEYGTSNIGLHAKLMGVSCQKNTFLAQKHNTTFIYNGQYRQNPGAFMGPSEVTQGGVALKFYAHMRIKIWRSTTKDNSQYEGDEKIGNLTKVSIEKNKLARPFRQTEFNILYGRGIDKLTEVIELGSKYDILKKRAGIITLNDTKYSLEEFSTLLEDNEEFRLSLEEQIKQKAYATKSEIQEIIPESSSTEIFQEG